MQTQSPQPFLLGSGVQSLQGVSQGIFAAGAAMSPICIFAGLVFPDPHPANAGATGANASATANVVPTTLLAIVANPRM